MSVLVKEVKVTLSTICLHLGTRQSSTRSVCCFMSAVSLSLFALFDLFGHLKDFFV